MKNLMASSSLNDANTKDSEIISCIDMFTISTVAVLSAVSEPHAMTKECSKEEQTVEGMPSIVMCVACNHTHTHTHTHV